MPTTRTRRSSSNGSAGSGSSSGRSASRSRSSRSRTSQSSSSNSSRGILSPVSDVMSSASRSVSRRVSNLPSWAPWVLGGIGVGALIYGLLQITAVSEFVSSVAEPIGEYFGSEDSDDSGEMEDLGSELSHGVSAPGQTM